jgi:hypothetical protein
MTIQRMDHVASWSTTSRPRRRSSSSSDSSLQGEGTVEGDWVDRVVGLEGVRAEIAMMETPDGHGGSSW